MDSVTVAALAELNRTFYAGFAADFARTRQSWPPGFQLILPHLLPAANVADLGCGNGRLLAFLAAQGWRGDYVGVDSNRRFLTLAEEAARERPEVRSRFLLADLLSPGWAASLGDRNLAVVVSLAVLHHIPGRSNRAHFLLECAALLRPRGLLVLSTWQFMTTPRLRAHILPWELAGVREEDVEPEDYLLAWGEKAAGRRYCAFIEEEALLGLAAEVGLAPVATFRADGYERNLNLYGIFRREDVSDDPAPESAVAF